MTDAELINEVLDWAKARESLSWDCAHVLGISGSREDSGRWGEELAKRCESLRKAVTRYHREKQAVEAFRILEERKWCLHFDGMFWRVKDIQGNRIVPRKYLDNHMNPISAILSAEDLVRREEEKK